MILLTGSCVPNRLRKFNHAAPQSQERSPIVPRERKRLNIPGTTALVHICAPNVEGSFPAHVPSFHALSWKSVQWFCLILLTNRPTNKRTEEKTSKLPKYLYFGKLGIQAICCLHVVSGSYEHTSYRLGRCT